MGLTTTYLTQSSPSLPVDGVGKHFIAKAIIDCTSVPCLTTDTPEVMLIKEGWFVRRVWVRVITLGTLAATTLASVGDSSNAAALITTDVLVGTSGTINTAVGSVHATDTVDVLVGKLYLADDYIYLTFGVGTFDGKLEIAAEILDVFGGDTIV